jgi:Domain of unknown function (DUF4272)
MTTNFNLIRLQSAEKCAGLGFHIPLGTPPLIDAAEVSPKAEVVVLERMLSLFSVLSIVFEPQATFKEALEEVGKWTAQYEVASNFSANENTVFFAKSSAQLQDRFWGQQESLYVLGWSLGWVECVDTTDYLPEDFGSIFPDITKGDSPEHFRSKCRLRSLETLLVELDFWYCLHWWVTEHRNDSEQRKKMILSTVAIRARRKALEWMVTDQDWDEVSLDT